MSLPRHIEDSTVRLKEASFRIDEARRRPVTLESLQDWLESLTDFAQALADIHTYNNESIHEKLHELSSRAGLRLPGAGRHGA